VTGKRVLIGEYNYIPGMSGGPVLDELGQVVGTVNAYIPGTPISLSREMRDTSVCGHGIA
jgi:S1-C subfamily serine protease